MGVTSTQVAAATEVVETKIKLFPAIVTGGVTIRDALTLAGEAVEFLIGDVNSEAELRDCNALVDTVAAHIYAKYGRPHIAVSH